MKSLKSISFLVIIISSFFFADSFAQSPQGMNYQAVARDASGALLPNKIISIRITITDGSGGPVLYRETHNALTNQFGLFALNVGNGTPVTNTFSSITWAIKTPWMQVEMDPNGGNAYVNMGTSQLLSVPYALYSLSGGTPYTAGSGISIASNTITNTSPDQTVVLNNGTGIAVTGAYPNFTITNSAPDQAVSIAAGTGISVIGTYPNFTIGYNGASPINGTTNYVIKFTGATTGGNSQIYDDGTNVGIGTTSPLSNLHVSGSNSTILGLFSNSDAAGDGIYGYNNAANGTSTGSGVTGISGQSGAGALQGLNINPAGTGLMVSGNNVSPSYLTNGSGAAITGDSVGLYVKGNTSEGIFVDGYTIGLDAVTTDPGTSTPVYTDNLGNIVAVNYWDQATTTQYKIIGYGTVSTIVKDQDNKSVVMHAPETPEIYFMDYGQARLVNGFVHVELDPTFAKNVTVNQKHPMRVFIQLEDNENCKGVVVKNKTTTGFDVVEMNGGTSNTPFQYQLVCNRADEVFPNGRISKNADARFESGAMTLKRPVKTVKTVETPLK